MTASSSLLSRAAVVAVAGLATLSVTACGSSDNKSGGGATTAAGTTSSAGTTSTTSGSAVAPSSASASDSSSAPVPASGQRYTAAQLDQAMKATTIDGKQPTVSSQAMVKESLSGADKFRSEVAKSLKISPAECQAAYTSAQALGDGSASIPASMGSLNEGKTAVVAMQLPANSPDKWDASKMQKCHDLTITGTVLGVSVSGKATLSPVDVQTNVATNPHGVVEVTTQSGKQTTVSIALARVGDVEIETVHEGSAVSGEQMGKELDAYAAQLKKLG